MRGVLGGSRMANKQSDSREWERRTEMNIKTLDVKSSVERA